MILLITFSVPLNCVYSPFSIPIIHTFYLFGCSVPEYFLLELTFALTGISIFPSLSSTIEVFSSMSYILLVRLSFYGVF